MRLDFTLLRSVLIVSHLFENNCCNVQYLLESYINFPVLRHLNISLKRKTGDGIAILTID